MEATSKCHDVIVVGGGPAGSLTAYHLAKAGLEVAILDAKRFPRDKPCGGGVQQRASQRIPFDWKSVVRGAMDAVEFSFGFEQRFRKTSPQPLVYSVLRTEFDELLLQAAIGAGAELSAGERVLSVGYESPDVVVVQTDRRGLRARFVVGADGANSMVGKNLNARGNFFWQVALYSEIPDRHVNGAASENSRMRIDWGSLPSGYAWVFPKHGSVNVGVGCPVAIGRYLRPYLSAFLQKEKILKPGAESNLRFSGHQLPTLTGRTKLATGRILLVGDAAGLVDPFTGDGISQACHSAEVAADTLVRNWDASDPVPAIYSERVWSEIGSDLLWARRLLSYAVSFPHLIYRLVRGNDSIWQAFCGVLMGEVSFKAFKKKVLGPLEVFWMPIQYFVESYEARKLADPGLLRKLFLEQAGHSGTPFDAGIISAS
ncbi:MAG: geranylgeranyl reductase family protein [Bryobacteraceae bacterium]|nr:geranylgeranyl reductase family protein [Bryobacteraceae bacterium]